MPHPHRTAGGTITTSPLMKIGGVIGWWFDLIFAQPLRVEDGVTVRTTGPGSASSGV